MADLSLRKQQRESRARPWLKNSSVKVRHAATVPIKVLVDDTPISVGTAVVSTPSPSPEPLSLTSRSESPLVPRSRIPVRVAGFVSTTLTRRAAEMVVSRSQVGKLEVKVTNLHLGGKNLTSPSRIPVKRNSACESLDGQTVVSSCTDMTVDSSSSLKGVSGVPRIRKTVRFDDSDCGLIVHEVAKYTPVAAVQCCHLESKVLAKKLDCQEFTCGLGNRSSEHTDNYFGLAFKQWQVDQRQMGHNYRAVGGLVYTHLVDSDGDVESPRSTNEVHKSRLGPGEKERRRRKMLELEAGLQDFDTCTF